MEDDQLIGESVILQLTIKPWRTPTEVIKVIGLRYASFVLEHKDAARCKTYKCIYSAGKVKGRTWVLDDQFIEPILEQLRTISIPLLPRLVPPGKDGGYYILEIGLEHTPSVRFHWWSRTPEGWEPLTKIAQQLHLHAKSQAGLYPPPES